MLNDALTINGFTAVRLGIAHGEMMYQEEDEGEGEMKGADDSYSNSDAVHYLYLKEHAIKRHHPSKPQKRTLFVCNVPPYLDEAAIKTLFESANCGHVQKVFLHLKPETGSAEEDAALKQISTFFSNPDDSCFSTRFAYVVFRTPSGVENAVKIPHDKPLILKRGTCRTGVEKWCQEYRELTAEFDLSSLEKEIETYVATFDKKKDEDAKQEKMGEQEDGEGWVKISRKRGARFTESEQQHQHRKEKKRKEEHELVHFYRFQLRESRREKIAELRKRFEEDKQRIALLRQQRKFKPF